MRKHKRAKRARVRGWTPQAPSPGGDGDSYAWKDGKCKKGDQCKDKRAILAPKDFAPAQSNNEQPKAEAKLKAAAPAAVRKFHINLWLRSARRRVTLRMP